MRVGLRLPYYTRWEIGGEPQPCDGFPFDSPNYTRWEIGGEPQLCRARASLGLLIIPDGRSGGNRNCSTTPTFVCIIIPDGRSGGNRNARRRVWPGGLIIPDGRSGGNRNKRGGTAGLSPELYPMGDRGGTATYDVTHSRICSLYPMGDRGGTATSSRRRLAE